jgi:hypothetical protein
VQAATGQQQYEREGLGGPSTNRSAQGLSEAMQRYLVRDFGRLQCLTALHEASKVRDSFIWPLPSAEGWQHLGC